MPQGLEVFNDAGTIVVTHNHKNPVLKAQGSVSTVANTIDQHCVSQATISYTAPASQHAIMAFRPPANFMYLTSYFHNGSSWVWVLSGNEPVSTLIPYWIFTPGDIAASSGGLEMFDASGTRVFSMQEKPLRIRDVVTGTEGARTFDAGRTYACSFCKYSGVLAWEPADAPGEPMPDEYWFSLNSYAVGVRGISNGVEFGSLPRSTPAPTMSPDYNAERDWSAISALAIDVTHY